MYLLAIVLSLVTIDDPLPDPGPEVCLAIYRAAQEALTNVRKHGAGRATLELEHTGERLRLTVRNPAEPVTSTDTNGGFGLLGLRERAGVIGGELATRHENGNFVLELEVPVP